MDLFGIFIGMVFLSSVSTTPVNHGFKEKPIQAYSGSQTINLVYVASADGKSFFADDVNRNWTMASAFCQSMRMKLASITSSAQFTALNAAAGQGFYSAYWTSGRESQMISQFLWTGTNTLASRPHVLRYSNHRNAVPLTCLVFEPYSQNTSIAYPYSCSLTRGALCET